MKRFSTILAVTLGTASLVVGQAALTTSSSLRHRPQTSAWLARANASPIAYTPPNRGRPQQTQGTGSRGCEAIAKYLKSDNCSLESLHLANNKCSDYGAKAIAQAIAVNKSLIHLDLTYNSINDLGLTLFAQALSQNTYLMSFKIFGNNFGQECLQLFYELF